MEYGITIEKNITPQRANFQDQLTRSILVLSHLGQQLDSNSSTSAKANSPAWSFSIMATEALTSSGLTWTFTYPSAREIVHFAQI